MTRIWERLYTGGIADAEELAEDNPQRITTVVSLTKSSVRESRKGINYLHLPIADDAPVDAISENIRWGTVLLHCGQGVGLAPSMAGAYMDAVGYEAMKSAVDEIRRLRPFISPSEILLNSLKENLR